MKKSYLAGIVILFAAVLISFSLFNNSLLGFGGGPGSISGPLSSPTNPTSNTPPVSGKPPLHQTTPDCIPPVWVTEGDPYFGNTQWSWMIRTTQTNPNKTVIGAPDVINGNVIGVASTFKADSLGDPLLSLGKSWVFPNQYQAIQYAFNWVPPNLIWADWAGSTNVTMQYVGSMDTSQATGVPDDLKSFLKTDAKVVQLDSINNEGVLPFFPTGQLLLVTSTWEKSWQGEYNGPNDYSYYQVGFDDVTQDQTLLLQVTKEIYKNGQWSNENQTISIPHHQEVTIGAQKIYNQSAKYKGESGSPDNDKEWAIINFYSSSDQRSDLEPVSRIVIQPVNNNDAAAFLEFGADPVTQGLFFIQYNDSPIQNPTNLRHDFFNDFENFSITAATWPYNALVIWRPENIFFGDTDQLEILFGLNPNTFEPTGLGNIPKTPEGDELRYTLEPQLWYKEIGNKTVNLLTRYGTRVRQPSANSPLDRVSFDIWPDVVEPVNVIKSRLDNWKIWRYIYPANIGRTFSDWLFSPEDDPWAHLLQGSVSFSGEPIRFHEALVFGKDTPIWQTSLTTDKDEYLDNRYFETQKAMSSTNQYKNDGMKYVFAFDDPIRLTDLSETNPLKLQFLGEKIDFLGYKQYANKDYLLVQKECTPVPECNTNSDCDDHLFCTIDTCNSLHQCIHSPNSCSDNRTCTTDTCNEQTKSCSHDDSKCCTTNDQCWIPPSHGDECWMGFCQKPPGENEGTCVVNKLSCDDSKKCTTDHCTYYGICEHTPIPDCDCESENDCAAGLVCCPPCASACPG